MLLKFYIDDEIHKLTHYEINKNIVNKICKCEFEFNEEIWKDEDIYITFMTKNGNGITMHIGDYKEKVTCIVPPNIFKHFCFKIFIYSEHIRTNIVAISVKNNVVPKIKMCNYEGKGSYLFEYARKDRIDLKLTDDGKMILLW